MILHVIVLACLNIFFPLLNAAMSTKMTLFLPFLSILSILMVILRIIIFAFALVQFQPVKSSSWSPFWWMCDEGLIGLPWGPVKFSALLWWGFKDSTFSHYTLSPWQMQKTIILDRIQLCQMAVQNSAMKGMGELQEDANMKHKSFIGI